MDEQREVVMLVVDGKADSHALYYSLPQEEMFGKNQNWELLTYALKKW